jgi:hypothetical protein
MQCTRERKHASINHPTIVQIDLSAEPLKGCLHVHAASWILKTMADWVGDR